MSFEYVEVGFADGMNQALVCERRILPQILETLSKERVMSVRTKVRIRLSRLANIQFEALMPEDADMQIPEEDSEELPVSTYIKFPLQSVRFAVSSLINEADRLGKFLRKHGHRPHRQNADLACPPCNVDGTIQWILQRETFKFKQNGDDPEFIGDPTDMHQTLARVLHDNINYHLGAVQDGLDWDDDEDSL